jgi:uncharacterized membrane protein (DUF485 family)
MISKIIDNIQKKSLNQRFLLVIRMLFFLIYLTFGLLVMFWRKLPLNLTNNYRIALGLLLIAYAFFRFVRYLYIDEENE